MFDIAGYLQKFKKLSSLHAGNKEAVSEAVANICGITIPLDSIDVKNTIVRINQKPIVKNEIFMKKEKVIEYLKQNKDMVITNIV